MTKEEFVKEFQMKYEIHPVELGLIADFWLSKREAELSDIKEKGAELLNTPHYNKDQTYDTGVKEVLSIIDEKLK